MPSQPSTTNSSLFPTSPLSTEPHSVNISKEVFNAQGYNTVSDSIPRIASNISSSSASLGKNHYFVHTGSGSAENSFHRSIPNNRRLFGRFRTSKHGSTGGQSKSAVKVKIQHMDSAVLLGGVSGSEVQPANHSAPEQTSHAINAPLPSMPTSSSFTQKRQNTSLSNFHRNSFSMHKKRRKRQKTDVHGENEDASSSKDQRDPLWKHTLNNQSFREFVMQNSDDLKAEVEKLAERHRKRIQPGSKLTLGVTLKLSHWYARGKINAKRFKYEKIREQLNYAIKKQGLITHIDPNGENLHNDKRKQVNLDMYNDENMLKRDDNRRSKKLNFFTWHWWLDMKKRASNSCIAKRTYIQMLYVIYEFLCPMMSKEEYEVEAERDWKHDSKGGINDISWENFRESVFELCDLWTDTSEEKEYVEFVRSMHSKLVEYARENDSQFIAHDKTEELYVPEDHEDPWFREEDEDLERLVNHHMTKRREILWAHLARDKKKGAQRTYSECENRFEALKSQWKEEEEHALMRLVDQLNLRHGNTNAALRPDDRVFQHISTKLPHGVEQLRRKYTELGDTWDAAEEKKFSTLLEKEKYALWRNRNSHNTKLKKLLVDQLSWKEIAFHIPKKDAFHCRHRYMEHYANTTPNRRPWSVNEDRKLIDLCQDQSDVRNVNWDRVAEHLDCRYPQECEERFNNQCIHWSNDEDTRLIRLAQQLKMSIKAEDSSGIGLLGKQEWVQISQQFPGKVPPACEFRYYYKSGDWKHEDDIALFQQVVLLGFNDKVWPKIDISMATKSSIDCKRRFFAKMGSWKKTEDRSLTDSVAQYGERSFSTISTLLPGRSTEECHARYMFLKQAWSPEEDNQLRRSAKKHGTNNWEIVSNAFDRRLADDCEERYRLLTEWQPSEDAALQRAVDDYGTDDWENVGKMVPLKTMKMCRKRYERTANKRLSALRTKELKRSSQERQLRQRSEIKVPPKSPSPTAHLSKEVALHHLKELTSNSEGENNSMSLTMESNLTKSDDSSDVELYRRYMVWKGATKKLVKRKNGPKIVLPSGGILKIEQDTSNMMSSSSLGGQNAFKTLLGSLTGNQEVKADASKFLETRATDSGDSQDLAFTTGSLNNEQLRTQMDDDDMRSAYSSARELVSTTTSPFAKSSWPSDTQYDSSPTNFVDPSKRERFETLLRHGQQHFVHYQYVNFYTDHSESHRMHSVREQNLALSLSKRNATASPDQWSRSLTGILDSSFRNSSQGLGVVSPPKRRNRSKNSSRTKSRQSTAQSLPQHTSISLEERFERSRKEISEKLLKLRMARIQLKREAKEEKLRQKEHEKTDKFSILPSLRT